MEMFGKLATLCALVIGVGSANAATLIVNGSGILTGATGVVVGGSTYDVTFADGTCAAVYGACTNDKFDFTTVTSAQAAGQSLLDQVFLDGEQGAFDSHPEYTFGCGNTIRCGSIIPYSTGTAPSINIVFSYNYADNASDQTSVGTTNTS